MRSVVKLLMSILACELVGIAGAFFTAPAIESWYSNLNKPFFSPPNFIFAPVWTLLYLLMGVAFYLIWQNTALKISSKAFIFFVLQLALNFLWSFLFFGLHSPFLGVACIVILWLAIFITIIEFFKIQKTAAYLLLPYLLWVSFATLLNIAVWQLN